MLIIKLHGGVWNARDDDSSLDYSSFRPRDKDP